MRSQRKYFTLLALSLTLFFDCSKNPVGHQKPLSEPTEIYGRIQGQLIQEDSPYHATASLLIASEDSLIIEPGVQILFDDSCRFHILGYLKAVGTNNQRITFTAWETVWLGILVESSEHHILFQFCDVNQIQAPSNQDIETGGITLIASMVSFQNCVIRTNWAGHGAGITAHNSQLALANNIFKDNQSNGFGGAVLSVSSTMNIFNNSFVENRSSNYGAALVVVEGQHHDIQNNIFHENVSPSGSPAISLYASDSSAMDIQYNFIGSSSQPPGFISRSDLRLTQNSPCRDQGNPLASFNDPDGSRNDQGAFGGAGGNWSTSSNRDDLED